MIDVLFLILGACVGSFLNVCIYRIPQKMSVVFGPSHCPHCSKPIKIQDLVPLLSFFLLKGKCRYCETKVSWRYPLVELLTAVLFYAAYQRWGLSWQTPAMCAFFSALVVAALVDFDTYLIPDGVLGIALILGIPTLWLAARELFFNGLVGFLSAGLLMLAIALATRGGMGGGDVKLSAVMGFFLGWPEILIGLFIAFTSGALVGLILMLLKKKKRKNLLPFGPYLALGGVIGAFYGEQLLNWYLSLF